MKEARMKIIVAALLAAGIALTSGFQSSSQDPEKSGVMRPEQSTQKEKAPQPERRPMTYNKASGIVGMNVHNQNNERLGEIKDVVFDLQSERVAYAVLGTGGFMDRDKLIAVPINAFTPSADNKYLILRTDKTKLATAKGFDRKDWPSVTNPSWGAQPFWENPPGKTDKDK